MKAGPAPRPRNEGRQQRHDGDADDVERRERPQVGEPLPEKTPEWTGGAGILAGGLLVGAAAALAAAATGLGLDLGGRAGGALCHERVGDGAEDEGERDGQHDAGRGEARADEGRGERDRVRADQRRDEEECRHGAERRAAGAERACDWHGAHRATRQQCASECCDHEGVWPGGEPALRPTPREEGLEGGAEQQTEDEGHRGVGEQMEKRLEDGVHARSAAGREEAVLRGGVNLRRVRWTPRQGRWHGRVPHGRLRAGCIDAAARRAQAGRLPL